MRRFYSLAASIFIALLINTTARAETPANVIIIVAESLGWNSVSYNGGSIDTPAIDSLANSGVKLDRFYTAPLSSPTRAGLMTGRHPIRLGLTYSDISPWDNVGVHPREHFMPQSFKHAGYQTAFIGSWGLGHAQQTFHPNQRGIDNFWGQLLLGSGLTPPYRNIGGVDFQHNSATLEDAAYLPQWIGEQASDYIKARDKNKPMFLMLSFPSPRDSGLAEPSSNCAAALNNAVAAKCNAYADAIRAMDASIGNVVSQLAAEGISDNTLLLFMGDSGSPANRVGSGNNSNVRGQRGQTLEGGIHVPAFIVWPGKLTAQNEINDIATMIDVFPTLAAATGVAMKNIRTTDGINLWPAIADGKSVKRKDPVVLISEPEQYGSFDLTAFDDNWKLVQKIDVDLIYIDVQNSLYKVGEDVDENTDLADQHPREVERLNKAIKMMRQQHPINGLRNNMIPPPGWRGPKDWAEYPISVALLQDVTAAGSPPPVARRPLDFQLGEKGRLIYDCEIKWWSLGFCIKGKEDEDIAVYDFHKKKDK